MVRLFNNKKPIFYKNILESYPAKVKRYILKHLIECPGYMSDITTVLRIVKNQKVDISLWFDLHKPEDLSSFITAKFKRFGEHFVPKADIVIVGVDTEGSQSEFFLEFSNQKIGILDEVMKEAENHFSFKLSGVGKQIDQVKNSLDTKNYFMCGIKYTGNSAEELKICFNINKKLLLSFEIPQYFSRLLDRFGLDQFRGERSYAINRGGEIIETIGWMVDCGFLPNFDIFIEALEKLSWTQPLVEELKLYAKKDYSSFLRWGWFSYSLQNNNISGIKVTLNYDE